MKFQVLRERTNVIASFPRYPVYIDFEMFSVLILGFLFWFVMTYSKSMCKSNLFFVILASFILLYHVWTKVNVWNFFFLEILGVPQKEQWYYFFHVYRIFKMYSVLIIDLFMFCRASPKWMYRIQFSWIFRCSGKEAVILLRSWSDLYIAVSKHLVSYF